MFRGVLEADGWSSRALVNWGKAMTGRAALAVQPEAAEKLYNAAIDKFEAVLAEEPGLAVAQYRWGPGMVCTLRAYVVCSRARTAPAAPHHGAAPARAARTSPQRAPAHSRGARPRRCALAMRGLAGVVGPGRAREAATLLQDAANYLGDVVAAESRPGGDDGLRAAAAAALAEARPQP